MHRIVISLLMLSFSTAAVALEELSQAAALSWLQKMSGALHTLNYEGVFVYQHGEQLTSMRLVHGLNKQGEHERLESLSGSSREVIRSNNKVICILPDSNSVIVKQSQSRTGFPYLLPKQLQQISDSYRFELGQRARVSGFISQQIRILPKDQHRYSYNLWVDTDSGMLLKAEVRDSQHVIEQFMFTTLRFMPNFPQELLAINLSKDTYPTYTHQSHETAEPAKQENINWKVGFLPAGFKLQDHQHQFQSGKDKINLSSVSKIKPIHQLVYSDGISTVSIFIEILDKGQSAMTGASPLGATNAYAIMIDTTQITVVGEVPAQTVRQIAESVRYQP